MIAPAIFGLEDWLGRRVFEHVTTHVRIAGYAFLGFKYTGTVKNNEDSTAARSQHSEVSEDLVLKLPRGIPRVAP